MNPTLRGFLIIGLIVVVDRRAAARRRPSTALFLLAQIAFFLAIAYFIYLLWRDRRQEISMWSSRSRAVFYGSAVADGRERGRLASAIRSAAAGT